MTGFSAAQAFGSGFRLIGREPLAVVAWAGAYLVLGFLPQAAMFGLMWPELQAFLETAQSGAEPDLQQMMGLMTKMPLLQLVSIVSSVVTTSVLLGAIYRAVLTPEDRRFLYLRFSGRELAIGLSMVVLYILFIVAMIALAIVCGVLIAVAVNVGPDWLGVIVGLAAAVVVIWLLVRFSLALPMAFAQSRFVIFESWGLTRGHALKIFLVFLGLFLAVAVAQSILFGILFGVMGVGFAGGMMGGVEDPAEVVARLWPWIALTAVVVPLVTAAAYAVLAAPSADIYRQLTRDEAEVF